MELADPLHDADVTLLNDVDRAEDDDDGKEDEDGADSTKRLGLSQRRHSLE